MTRPWPAIAQSDIGAPRRRHLYRDERRWPRRGSRRDRRRVRPKCPGTADPAQQENTTTTAWATRAMRAWADRYAHRVLWLGGTPVPRRCAPSAVGRRERQLVIDGTEDPAGRRTRSPRSRRRARGPPRAHLVTAGRSMQNKSSRSACGQTSSTRRRLGSVGDGARDELVHGATTFQVVRPALDRESGTSAAGCAGGRGVDLDLQCGATVPGCKGHLDLPPLCRNIGVHGITPRRRRAAARAGNVKVALDYLDIIGAATQ